MEVEEEDTIDETGNIDKENLPPENVKTGNRDKENLPAKNVKNEKVVRKRKRKLLKLEVLICIISIQSSYTCMFYRMKNLQKRGRLMVRSKG